jgi:GT2 family glycosyltransferase
MKPRMIDVIIVNFNSTDWVLRCLESFHGAISRRDVRVFVQDNCSSDGAGRIEELFPEVSLSRNHHNLGFARAVNNALRLSSSDYAVIVNPDTVVLDGFFSTALGYMEANPEVGVLGPAVLDGDGAVQGSARAFPTFLTGLFGRTSFLTRLLPNNAISRANILSHRSDGRTPFEVDWVSGACMMVRRKAIEEVGMLDPRFFIYWEDADWCRRMWERGWKVVYLPVAKVVHYVGVSSSTKPIRSLLEFHRSSFKLFNKHAGPAYRAMSPLVALGLAMRFCLVTAVSRLRRSHGRNDQEGVTRACERGL